MISLQKFHSINEKVELLHRNE